MIAKVFHLPDKFLKTVKLNGLYSLYLPTCNSLTDISTTTTFTNDDFLSTAFLYTRTGVSAPGDLCRNLYCEMVSGKNKMNRSHFLHADYRRRFIQLYDVPLQHGHITVNLFCSSFLKIFLDMSSFVFYRFLLIKTTA